MAHIPPIPRDSIGEGHPWREWFFRVGEALETDNVGQVTMPAGAATVTLTSRLITSSSKIFLTFASNPGTSVSLYSVPTSGSAAINATATIANTATINYQINN